MGKLNRLFVALAVTPGLLSCVSAIDANDTPKPVLLALSTDTLSIGDPLEFLGANFLNNTRSGHPEVRFKGEFKSDKGHTYAVDYVVRPRWSDGNRLIWPFVGPYANPFSGPTGDQLGKFEGTVTAANVADAHGSEAESEAVPVTLTFGPSIIIRDFQPLMATCDQPAKRVLGGFPYKVSVEAVGFTPVNFSYIIEGDGEATPRLFRNVATGTTDSFGSKGELVFANVPDAMPFYLAGFGVRALGTDGIEHTMQLVVGVHRPIEYIDSGETHIAQIEAAKPDSGCLSGGNTTGTTVSYTETHTDTRTRTVGLTWDEQFLTSATMGGSTTKTNSVNWSATHTDMQSWQFGWTAGGAVTVEGKASIPLLAEGGVSTTVSGGVHKDHNWGYSDSRTVGGDYSQADTESWATTTSHTVGKGSSDFWAVSSSDSTSLAFQGLVLPGRFGVFYRQVTRVAIPAAIVTYNLCGNSEVVAQANFYDYLWSIDLAQGDTCSPLPKSKLPEAQCLMEPCGST